MAIGNIHKKFGQARPVILELRKQTDRQKDKNIVTILCKFAPLSGLSKN